MDAFAAYRAGLDSPAEHAAVVVPSDTEPLPFISRALMVTGGEVRVTTKGGETLTLPGVSVTQVWPLRISKVWATGTDAHSIIALW